MFIAPISYLAHLPFLLRELGEGGGEVGAEGGAESQILFLYM